MRKVVTVLKKLNRSLQVDDILHCSTEYLRRLVKGLGFRWAKCQSARKLLIEKAIIIEWRDKFLKEIRRYRT